MKTKPPPARAFYRLDPVVRLSLRCRALLLFLVLTLYGTLAGETSGPRKILSLNGDWSFQTNGAAATEWKTVQVPSSFQSHEGTQFHGIGWYKKSLSSIILPPGKRALLHFQAAATEAEVWFDGQRLGSHLGGWTPFRFDVTELIRAAPPGNTHELKVRLDEKVGHNTQGFLPMIAPHFGGIWQEVQLLIVPENYCDDLELMANGDWATHELRLQVPVVGANPRSVTHVQVRYRLRGEEGWKALSSSMRQSNSVYFLRAPIPEARAWSPAEPNLYEVEIGLEDGHQESDRVLTRVAFRSLEAFGPELRLNGQPLSLRGVLNWGYSAPLVEPNPGEAVWRSELEFARSRGFNLMKFCLWVPPQRYLELADEMGVLAWMEYPTWHPDFSAKFLEPLRREFSEFFRYDRNHPSVVLRSLTCETGPSADLAVLRSLYDQAHQMIPGALVEDDSSWIGWNRIHDFYDDHPYGNNHTWVKTLAGFREYILAHGVKPLVLGETTSADTWVDRESVRAQMGSNRPWWAPAILDDLPRWSNQMQRLAGSGGLESLRSDSLRYGMLMRKYQIEAFRRELPYGGYVITGLRDFPACSMGLLDYAGRPKWSAEDWSWQRDTMCLLKMENDRRSFTTGEPLNAQVLLSHFGQTAIERGELGVTLESGAAAQPGGVAPKPLNDLKMTGLQQNPGTLAKLAELDWVAPPVSQPERLLIKALLKTAQGEFRNQWPVWVVPHTSPELLNRVSVHSSVDTNLANELFPGCPSFVPPSSASASRAADSGIVVASRFDHALARFVEHGGRVLFLPDGQSHSFALSAHWFLRGAPYIPESALTAAVPRDLLLELQHFDLASEVVPNLPQLDSFDPLLLLWDTHDQKAVRTHGLVFETRIGQGRLLVSALKHNGQTNPAGHWLLQALLNHLRSGAPPRHTLPPEVWNYANARLDAKQINLAPQPWSFMPDPQAEGLALGWHKPEFSDADWKPIRVGDWWENQGYPELDGWAWYRTWVNVPADWKHVFLSFEGVDDMYELYVNGKFVGKSGDLAARKDALNERKSYDLDSFVTPGGRTLAAVRVYDWYGYGGIFRPVTLGTLPLNPSLDLLK